MIQNYSDYLYYTECDKIALNLGNKTKISLLFNEIWKFQKLMRKIEYFSNTKKGKPYRLYLYYLNYRYLKLCVKLGFTMSPNTFGPGLSIAHWGTLIVNEGAKIGSNCRIHNCIHIGTKAGFKNLAPQLGDNIYIGPGARIIGDIKIANNIAIGANSVVLHSFSEEGITIAGIPAKKISDNGSTELLIKATEIVRRMT